MWLNCCARPSSSSPVWISMRRERSPAPIRSAPAAIARMGPVTRRAMTSATKIAAIRPNASSTRARHAAVRAEQVVEGIKAAAKAGADAYTGSAREPSTGKRKSARRPAKPRRRAKTK